MFRTAFALLFIVATSALAALDDSAVSPAISAPLRSIPASLPKKEATDSSFQLQGVDSELHVGVSSETATPSVFDGLSADNNATNLQKAQILLKRNLLDDVTLSYRNNVGLANTTPTQNNSVTAQTAQSQSTSEINWNINDSLSLTGANQMDQIFEFQRAEPSHTRNSLESRYSPGPGTTLGLGASNDTYFQDNLSTFQRETTTGLYQQKLGKLPLSWSANPAYISEGNPYDSTQNRAGTAMNQSLLWNVTPDFTWNIGGGVTTWDYSTDLRKESDRTLFSQWTRQLRKNIQLNFRTDLLTAEATTAEGDLQQREKTLKLTLGQRLTLTDDLSADFDLQQQYQREINSTWAPADHSATFSIRKKF